MNRKKEIIPIITIFLATLIFTASGFQNSSDHKVLFEKAKYTMETKGDLNGAIKLFEEIIQKYPDEREYAAKSQLYIGICYEKLGLEQAQQAYRDVINKFSEQEQEVARAKERISRLEAFTASLDSKAEEHMKKGDDLKLLKLEPAQHFTKPAPRYGEASLVRELEKRGIGRPSTYASIISTIQDRGYVRLENKRFYAEKMGEIVTQRLQKSFTDLLDYGFTAGMEEHLDEVAQGKLDWRELLDKFYAEFRELLERAEEPEPAGMQPNEPTMTDIACDKCGRPMQIRTASTGVFLGCSGYALPPKERCKNTINLTPGDEAIREDADDEAESRLLRTKPLPVGMPPIPPPAVKEVPSPPAKGPAEEKAPAKRPAPRSRPRRPDDEK